MTAAFDHRHAGHCESGTLSALLRNRGLDLSEPMVFGIGGGLFFLHAPFIKVGNIPLTAYRGAPRVIIKNVCKRLGVVMRYQRFHDPEQGMRALDAFMQQGQPVGLQTCVYWLPYFPPELRFQFNAHNLVAFGKQDGHYLLSDPVFEHTVTCPAQDLRRARFARGRFAPRGLIYYPETVPRTPDLHRAVRAALRDTCGRMLDIPLPFLGVRGMRYMARRLPRWPRALGEARARSRLGSVVRMQEEIGTGGAGFRFMYAAFLSEAAQRLEWPRLAEAARMVTAAGDRWREFALLGAQVCKGHETGADAYVRLSAIVQDCAAREEHVFRLLRQAL